MDEGVQRWREAIQAIGENEPSTKCWLLGRIAAAWIEAGKETEFRAAYDEAIACAGGDSSTATWLQETLGRRARERWWLEAADAAFAAAAQRTAEEGPPLAHAHVLDEWGQTRYLKGDTSSSIAGARSVLASLWAVPDSYTVDLMQAFYEGLRKGLPKHQTLRQAQMAAIGKGGAASRPLRWAGFQLFGDWK